MRTELLQSVLQPDLEEHTNTSYWIMEPTSTDTPITETGGSLLGTSSTKANAITNVPSASFLNQTTLLASTQQGWAGQRMEGHPSSSPTNKEIKEVTIIHLFKATNSH